MTARSSTGEAARRRDAHDRASLCRRRQGARRGGARARRDGARAGRYAPGEALPREDDLAGAFRRQPHLGPRGGQGALGQGPARSAAAHRASASGRARTWNLLDPAVLSWHPDLTGDHDADAEPDRDAPDHRAARRGHGRERAPAPPTSPASRPPASASRPPSPTMPRPAARPTSPSTAPSSPPATTSCSPGLIGTIEAALRAVFIVTNRDAWIASPRRSPRIATCSSASGFRDAGRRRAAMNRLIDIAAADLGRSRTRTAFSATTTRRAASASPKEAEEALMKIVSVEPFILHVPVNRDFDLRFEPHHQPLGRGRRADRRPTTAPPGYGFTGTHAHLASDRLITVLHPRLLRRTADRRGCARHHRGCG